MGTSHSKKPDPEVQAQSHQRGTEQSSAHDGEFVGEYEEENIQDEDRELEEKLTNHLGKTCKVMVVNWTTFSWDLTSCHAHHGHFIKFPAKTLKPRERTICATSSATSFTGTTATLIYRPNVPTSVEPIQFDLYWTVPFKNEPRFTYKAPSEFSIEIALRKEYTEANASISFYITELSLIEGKSIPFAVLERLTQVTYFDRHELRLLYRVFMRAVAPKRSISPDQFPNIFPEFDNSLLLRSIFNAFDFRESEDNEISFSEFVEVLSVMVRGSLSERAELAFRICDLNKDGMVERNEVLQVYQQVVLAVTKYGMSTESYSDPRNLVRSIFRRRAVTTPKGGSKHQHDLLHYQEREGIATTSPILHTLEDQTTKPGRRERLKQRLKHPLSRNDTDEPPQYYGDEGPEDLRDEEELLDEFGTEETRDFDDQGVEDDEDMPPWGSRPVHEGKEDLYHDQLSRGEFMARAKRDPDYFECFGLFDYFYNRIVLPIEREAEKVTNPVMKGWLLKKRHGRVVKHYAKSDRYWFELRSGFLAYFDNNQSRTPKNVLSLADATVNEGIGLHFKVIIGTWCRTLFARDVKSKTIWVNALRANIKGVNRYKSFAPVRKNIKCEWFVNGKEYFDELLPALRAAKRRVYITDWFFTPYLFLKRSVPLNPNERLDVTLIDLAKRDVEIFVIIWNAPKLAYDLRADAVAQFLNDYQNIYVLTHPNRLSLWTHHQKLVVIDEEIAFLGGIDLCYGRYEDSNYLVTDPNGIVYPSRDYQNVNQVTEANGPAVVEIIDRAKTPWHDIQIKVEGMAAYDVGVNFIQRWNHALKTGSKISTKQAPFIMPFSLVSTVGVTDMIGPSATRLDEILAPLPEKIDNLTSNTNVMKEHSDQDDDTILPAMPVDPSNVNASVDMHQARNIRESIKEDMKKEQLNIVTEVADTQVEHEFQTADVADEVSVRIRTGLERRAAQIATEHLHTNQILGEDSLQSPGPFSLPTKKSDRVESQKARYLAMQIGLGHIDKKRLSATGVGSEKNEVLVQAKSGLMHTQIVRSVSHWSAGVAHPESSIHHAMLSAVTNAKKFIFIGNQYFISSIDRPSPKNRLLKALYHRISQAILKNEPFKVVVVLPVYPSGDLNSPTTTYIIQFVYMSIVRFKSSLLDRLQRDFPLVDMEQYITFHASWGVLNGKPVTEQVYVHAKVMIVDDRTLIVGSANINDRSLRGTRDREICAVVEEDEACWINSTMNCEPWKVSAFVHSLRCRLWCDYLGLNDVKQVQDPISAQFYRGVWLQTARDNTLLFLEVFQVLPDNVLTLSDIKKLSCEGIEYQPGFMEKLNQIRGIPVQFPREFLKNTDLEPALMTKEKLLPKIVFM